MSFYCILPWNGYYLVPPVSGSQYSCNANLLTNYYRDASGVQRNDQVSFSQQVHSQHLNSAEEHIEPPNQGSSPKNLQPVVRSEQISTRKKIKKQGRRRPDRNVLTNVGNQIFIFAHNRKRSQSILRRHFPTLSEQQTNRYYSFARGIKRSMKGYFNLSKLREVWLDTDHEDLDLYKILRTLCYHYLREKLVMSILISRKILPANRTFHLQMRRKLLRFFIDGAQSVRL